MPEWFSIVVLVCGLSIFVASLFQFREYLKFRKASRTWIWNLDPEAQAKVIQQRVDALRAAERNSDKASRPFLTEMTTDLNDPEYREELARRYEELASSLRHARKA